MCENPNFYLHDVTVTISLSAISMDRAHVTILEGFCKSPNHSIWDDNLLRALQFRPHGITIDFK